MSVSDICIWLVKGQLSSLWLKEQQEKYALGLSCDSGQVQGEFSSIHTWKETDCSLFLMSAQKGHQDVQFLLSWSDNLDSLNIHACFSPCSSCRPCFLPFYPLLFSRWHLFNPDPRWERAHVPVPLYYERTFPTVPEIVWFTQKMTHKPWNYMQMNRSASHFLPLQLRLCNNCMG